MIKLAQKTLAQTNLPSVVPDRGTNLPTNVPVDKLNNPLGDVDTIYEFLLVILNLVVQIGTPVIVLAVIYSGFLFVRAQGNPSKLDEAKQALLYTAIGAAIVLGAYTITTVIERTVTGLGAG